MRRISLTQVIATGSLLFLCALFAFPFLWMFFATFKANPEIFKPFPILPETYGIQHYKALLTGQWIPFPRQVWNSFFIAMTQTLLAIMLSASTGYVFAQYEFRGKRLLFALAILVVLIPRQVMVLPLFTWMHDLGLLDGPWAVIWPGVVSGIGILYFTLVFKKLPHELLDLARSEGASEYRVFLTSLPLIKPSLIAYGLIHFILAWHEHIIPLVMLSTRERMTANVALSSLYGSSQHFPYGLLMAGSTLTVVPTVALYFLVQRHFKSSLSDLTLQ
jgi:ABC-type glycerol-3-phosphate transport system permease component